MMPPTALRDGVLRIAADAAQAALEAQTLHLGELQAQLAALQDATAKTIAAKIPK